MRISTAQMYRQGVDSLLASQGSLAKTQLQLATGKNILSASDDPSGSKRVLDLNSVIETTRQYQANADIAVSRQSLEESVLADVTEGLNRVRELAIQANSGAMSGANRRALAVEVRERLSQLVGLANTQDANQEYLFSGYKTGTKPFSVDGSYNGDQGSRQLQISPSARIAVGDSGTDVFLAIRNGNGTFQTREAAGNIGSGVIDPGTVSDPSAYDGDTYTVRGAVRTGATGTLGFGDANANDTLAYTLKIDGTTVYSVSESGAPAATLDDLATQINDDLGTTGVQAHVRDGALYLTRTSPSTAGIVVTEELSGASDGDADTVTGYFGATLTGLSRPSADLLYDTEATGYVALDSLGNVEAAGEYTGEASIAFNGILTGLAGVPLVGDSFTISPSGNQDLFTTLGDLADLLESNPVTPADKGHFANGLNRFLTDVDRGMENVDRIRATVGARLNTVESQQGVNEDAILYAREHLSALQDLDYAEAASRLQLQLVSLQAAQQAFVKVQGLSLFNYL